MVCSTIDNFGPLRFRFNDDGHTVEVGYQTSWETWDEFRAAYDRQRSLFIEDIPPLGEFARAYERRRPAPAERVRGS